MVVKIDKNVAFKVFHGLVLVAILGLLVWSQPWSNTSQESRKVTVSGSGYVEAEPDEYIFNPYFEAKGSDQEALKKTLTNQANDTVSKLKSLGVEEKNITLDLSSYEDWYWRKGEEGRLTANLMVKASNKELAQKIQDYLLNTDAKGQLTSDGTFSEEKTKQLQSEAEAKAIEEAKTKAQAQASKFDAKLGKVIEIGQSSNYGVQPLDATARLDIGVQSEETAPSIPVLNGQNRIYQTVSVTFELK